VKRENPFTFHSSRFTSYFPSILAFGLTSGLGKYFGHSPLSEVHGKADHRESLLCACLVVEEFLHSVDKSAG
jgi:hypothetical protein